MDDKATVTEAVLNAHGVVIHDDNGNKYDVKPFDIIVNYPKNHVIYATAFIHSLKDDIMQQGFESVLNAAFASLHESNEFKISGAARDEAIKANVSVAIRVSDDANDEDKALQAAAFLQSIVGDNGERINNQLIQYAATSSDASLIAALQDNYDDSGDGDDIDE